MYWDTKAANGTPAGIESELGGSGWTSNSQEHAFNLTNDEASVPEPASMLLLGAGLLGLAWFRRR
jgi:hypothetical protein